MARENLANALGVLGQGLFQYSSQRAEQEFRALQMAREESLIRLRHDLDMNRAETERGYRIEEAEADRTFAAEQAEADRTFRAGESEADRVARRDLFRDETRVANERQQQDWEHDERMFDLEGERLQERYRRDDINELGTMHAQTIRRIDDRLQDVRDALAKEEYFPGSPGYDDAMNEMDQLQLNKYRAEFAFAQRMRDLGAAGYEGQTDEQILANLGFSDDEIRSMLAEARDDPAPPGSDDIDRMRDDRPTAEPEGRGVASRAPSIEAPRLEPVSENFDLMPGPVPKPITYSPFGRKPARRRGPQPSAAERARSSVDWLEPPRPPQRSTSRGSRDLIE